MVVTLYLCDIVCVWVFVYMRICVYLDMCHAAGCSVGWVQETFLSTVDMFSCKYS